MSTLSELLQQREALAAQQAALEQALRQAQAAERQGAIDKIRALMADHGLSPADLADAPTRGRRRGKADDAAPRAGKPVAAKFRNAATGETWSGRGLKPKWLSAALAEGRSLEDFRIAAA